MLRQLSALLAIVSCSAASAATLSVNADKLTYLVGETITLAVVADDEGTTAFGIFGQLLYNGALVDNGTRSQTTLVFPTGTWVPGFLDAGDTNANAPDSAFSRAFNQVSPNGETATNLPGNLSTVTLIATALGIVDLAWDTSPGELSFFGLTDAPGNSFTIVPEPTTVVLLSLGLLGLAMRGKSRH